MFAELRGKILIYLSVSPEWGKSWTEFKKKKNLNTSALQYCNLVSMRKSSSSVFNFFLLGFSHVKGTVSRDFWPIFFCLKDSTWVPYEQAKTVSRTFSFLQRYSRKPCVSIVNNYADTRQHSKRLRGHRVSVVNDYADTQEIIFLWKKWRKKTKK